MILCEKPLALNGEQGEKMVEAVEKSGLPNLVWYNYRFLPAVTLAKNSSPPASSAASSTTARTSFRNGRFQKSSPKAVPDSGVSMPQPLDPASPVIC